MTKEVFISVDIEADGAIPGDYSMLSIGACVVENPAQTFYRELKPLDKAGFDPEAVKVTGRLREDCLENGNNPLTVMEDFDAWVQRVRNGQKAVFVGFNATFDWLFVHWYFIHYLGRSPFGIAGLDIKAFYMGRFATEWRDACKRPIKKHLNSLGFQPSKHTHNALDDALEQAAIFAALLKIEPRAITRRAYSH